MCAKFIINSQVVLFGGKLIVFSDVFLTVKLNPRVYSRLNIISNVDVKWVKVFCDKFQFQL